MFAGGNLLLDLLVTFVVWILSLVEAAVGIVVGLIKVIFYKGDANWPD